MREQEQKGEIGVKGKGRVAFLNQLQMWMERGKS